MVAFGFSCHSRDFFGGFSPPRVLSDVAPPMNDSELLRRFAEEQSEQAFAELVGRRIGLVYSAALRQLTGDSHRAKDVTQTVFIDLARKARSLRHHPALIGWLYTSTHHAAAKMIRAARGANRIPAGVGTAARRRGESVGAD